jgi:geranylgeranyl pyrophosphate synthase
LIKQFSASPRDAVASNAVNNEIIEMLKKAGTIDYVMMKAMDFVEKAKERVYVLNRSNASDALERLAEYAVLREH